MNKFWAALGKSYKNFENALYPEYSCIICGRETRDTLLLICDKCKEKLLPINFAHTCQICGAPVLEGNTRCDDCRSQDIHFDKAVAAYIFDDTSANLVYGIKYSNAQFAARHLATLLVEPISTLEPFDIIIPVPLHENRKKWRGYNQSELVASALSELTSIPLETQALVRHIETETQQGKGRIERQANMVGAFKVVDKEKIKGKSILLIDDVFTTGTTVNECARILKKNGAYKVFVATLLKAISAYGHTPNKETK